MSIRFYHIFIGLLFLIVIVVMCVSWDKYNRGFSEPPELVIPIQEARQIELDCNRPEGRKVWKVDSITFYKDLQLTLKSGDVNESVDASNWLCVISPAFQGEK